MPRYFGNAAQTYVGATALPVVTAGVPAGKIGDTLDYSFPASPIKADRSSNDTGKRAANGVVQVEGDLTFKAIINRADPGQAILFAASIERGGTGNVFVEHHPEGTGAGKPWQRFEAIVDLKPDGMRNQWAQMAVTLNPVGEVAHGTQA